MKEVSAAGRGNEECISSSILTKLLCVLGLEKKERRVTADRGNQSRQKSRENSSYNIKIVVSRSRAF